MRDNINLIYEYAESVSGPVPAYLDQVERQTYLKTMAPQMLSGRLQGRLLSMLSKIHRPKTVLELGTFTGYSALCLAEGLDAGGTIHTVEGNLETAFWAEQNITASPFADRIQIHKGQAADILPTLPDSFDLIFMDGDKRGYPDYFHQLIDRMNPGGLLLADNILWAGRVKHKDTKDADAQALRLYNQILVEDERVDVVVLPLRDGLSIARKI